MKRLGLIGGNEDSTVSRPHLVIFIHSVFVVPSPRWRGGNVLVVHTNRTTKKRLIYDVLRHAHLLSVLSGICLGSF